MTQSITPVPVDAKRADWPRLVATVLNRLQNTTALASGTAAWGSITGTLSAQTDLQTALDLKANLAGPTFTATGLRMPRQYSTCAPFSAAVRMPIHGKCVDRLYQPSLRGTCRVCACS